ncbi:MAG: hypothetical protein KGJ30_13670 [Burkholderiales bacterium]|nr:hypothetical protein [Burkholderiales bacterium]MDE2159958.1 hypothetical protein [Burkholderiales bacterium]
MKFSVRIRLALLIAAASGAAFAQPAPGWADTHPRRAEVNSRLAAQNRRIHHEIAEGEMSKARAARLHREDRRIRRQERALAARDHGHITPGEQRALNARENRVSRQIGH